MAGLRLTLDFPGTEKIEIDDAGNLLLHTAFGLIRQEPPSIYQSVGELPDEILQIAGGYVLLDSQRVGFMVGSYDKAQPLVVDPVLVYSTYLGGADDENVPSESVGGLFARRGDIAVDTAGNIYVTGTTASTNFPVQNAFRTTNSGINAFSPRSIPPCRV